MDLLSKSKNKLLTLSFIATSLLISLTSQATVVQFETNFGNFEVNLYDQGTPETVANFLQYVEDGDYTNTIIHRSISGFIIQGGGLTYNGNWPADNIATNAPVTNEPVFSNVRGTIAMAKVANNPNSATSQWFFNLADNSGGGAALDTQNEGFTVFGEVVGDGMTIVDQIAAVPTISDLPLQNYDGVSDPDSSNLIIISSVQVTDTTIDSASGLNPPLNSTPAPAPEPESESGSSSSGGGGSVNAIVLIALFGLRRKLNFSGATKNEK